MVRALRELVLMAALVAALGFGTVLVSGCGESCEDRIQGEVRERLGNPDDLSFASPIPVNGRYPLALHLP